jgi:succinoglycan biosynthesis protein ExoL
VPAEPLIAYFVHHAEDPAYRRRIAMFNTGRAQVLALGFTREQGDLKDINGARFIRLGSTEAENNKQRILSVLTAVLKTAKWAPEMAHADVIIARNLECLALAVLARRWCRPGTPIHYEVLDIHRLTLRTDMIGKALRKLEAVLMKHCQQLILSSPAFETQYFSRFHDAYPSAVIVENKVFPAPEVRPPRPPNAAGPQLRIGWFGVLRCRKSLLMLRQLAADPESGIEVHIRGKIASTVIPDFEELIAECPNIHLHGAYKNPEDLQRIYTEVDIAWAIDYYEEGQNSLWLLPNRIYESCLYGCVPLAIEGTQTANWLKGRRLGLIAQDFAADTLRGILNRARSDGLETERTAIAAAKMTSFASTEAECRELVHVLCRAAPSHAPLSAQGMNDSPQVAQQAGAPRIPN